MEYDSLEIEKFIERDMVEFLDAKKAEMAHNAPHSKMDVFMDELEKALTSNSLKRASEVLEEAIDHYNTLAEKDVYKEITFNKLIVLVETVRKYVILNKISGGLAEDIRLIQESGQLEGRLPYKITVFEERKKERAQKDFERSAREYEEKERIKAKIKKLREDLTISLRKKELGAVQEKYRIIKLFFEQFPKEFFEEKKEIYNDIIALYLQIQLLKKEQESVRKSEQDKLVKLSAMMQEQERKYIRLDEIKQKISDIKDNVKHHEFDSAKAKVLELRHITGKIPDEYKNIRNILNAKIDLINQRIEFAKRISEHQKKQNY